MRLTTDLLAMPVLLVVAAVATVRRLTAPIVALVLALVAAGPVFVMLFNIAPRGVGALIVERFYLLPAALVSVLASLALDRLGSRFLSRGAFAFAITAMVMVTGFALGASRVAEGHRPTIELYVKNTLRAAPPRAIVLGSGDQKFAGFLYGQRVARPSSGRLVRHARDAARQVVSRACANGARRFARAVRRARAPRAAPRDR